MNKNKFRMVLLILCLIFCAGFGTVTQDAIDVSLINLIATPDKYHGKIIRVIGVSNLEFEGDKIYLSKEDRANGITKNAIWISPNYKIIGKSEKDLSKFNGQYVLLEGVFNKNNTGHMGLCSGSIDNITRFESWPPEIIKKRLKNS